MDSRSFLKRKNAIEEGWLVTQRYLSAPFCRVTAINNDAAIPSKSLMCVQFYHHHRAIRWRKNLAIQQSFPLLLQKCSYFPFWSAGKRQLGWQGDTGWHRGTFLLFTGRKLLLTQGRNCNGNCLYACCGSMLFAVKLTGIGPARLWVTGFGCIQGEWLLKQGVYRETLTLLFPAYYKTRSNCRPSGIFIQKKIRDPSKLPTRWGFVWKYN